MSIRHFTSSTPDFRLRRPVGGRFGTNWRQLLLTEMRHRNALRAYGASSGPRPPSPVPSSYLGEAFEAGTMDIVEPPVDVPGRPVDPGSIIGPPLRSGYIQGQARPVFPGASSTYPIVVPEPRRLKPVLFRSFTTGGAVISAGVPYVASLNDMIPRTVVSSNGDRTSHITRCLGFRVRGYLQASAPSNIDGSLIRAAVLLIYDKQPEAAIPPATDMFDPNPRTGHTDADSFPKFGTRDRYKILYRRDLEVVHPWMEVSPLVYDSFLIPKMFSYFTASVNCNLPVNYGRETPPGPGSVSLGNIYLVVLGPPDLPYTSPAFRIDIDYLYRDN